VTDSAPDPAPDPEEVARRSTEEMLRGDAAGRALGLEHLDVGPGRAEVGMAVRPDMVNGWDICHGGLIATLADTAFAVACNAGGEVTVAAGFDISFLEPGRLGDRLVARAREVSRRGRSGIYDVTVVREPDGVVLAEFRGRSRSTGRPNPALSAG
jgi:acyl-CoA thioesterase